MHDPRGPLQSLHTVDYPVIDVTEDTWAQLPGGLDQKVPKINPLLRYAYNLLATTPNTPYQFRYETGAVVDRDENLYFPYDVEDRYLIVKGIGVRARPAWPGAGWTSTATPTPRAGRGRRRAGRATRRAVMLEAQSGEGRSCNDSRESLTVDPPGPDRLVHEGVSFAAGPPPAGTCVWAPL